MLRISLFRNGFFYSSSKVNLLFCRSFFCHSLSTAQVLFFKRKVYAYEKNNRLISYTETQFFDECDSTVEIECSTLTQ